MRQSLLVFAAALLLMACDHRSPDEKLLASIKPAVSWSAALQMAAERWVANSVPARFVKNAAEAAGKEIDKELKAVGKSKAGSDLRKRVAEELRSERQVVDALKNAAENDQRPAASRLIPQLDALHRRMESLQR